MRITIEEATAFINFVRRADNEGQLSNVDCWGSGDTGSSSDEWGDDPYYEWVTLHFMDGEGEEHEISFSDTTCHFARGAMWKMADAIRVLVDSLGCDGIIVV